MVAPRRRSSAIFMGVSRVKLDLEERRIFPGRGAEGEELPSRMWKLQAFPTDTWYSGITSKRATQEEMFLREYICFSVIHMWTNLDFNLVADGPLKCFEHGKEWPYLHFRSSFTVTFYFKIMWHMHMVPHSKAEVFLLPAPAMSLSQRCHCF